MPTEFIPSVTPPTTQTTPAYWFIFDGYRLLVHDEQHAARVPCVTAPQDVEVTAVHVQYLGYLTGPDGRIDCYAAEAGADQTPVEGMGFYSLRQLFTRLSDEAMALAGRAVQIVEWDRTHQFCGRCATPVEQQGHERAKRCPACGLTSYPRLSPAIIVSVERPFPDGPRLLLAHNKRHPAGFYSVLAGFVEPGESLEDCVRREIREEVGIEVNNIRYFGSQPWPFPHSLMIAFTAEYADGTLDLEEEELDDAGWFKPGDLPLVPPPISIARQLIDAFEARTLPPEESAK